LLFHSQICRATFLVPAIAKSFAFFPLVLDVVRKVEAVLGRFGQLSCNLTSEIRDDRVALVIWYKEGRTTPIYSYDARDSKAVDGGSHHGINLDGKFYFNTSSLNPATFSIANLTADDEGTYRCRVDFLRSPTKNTKVQLTVIVPPENLLILNEKGKHISHYILGPYNEGSSINLTCISSGGRPLPKLTWWHNNQLLEGVITRLSDKKVRNVLHMKNLDRKDLLSSYTCQSSNNNLTDPITSSVMIDLNCKSDALHFN
jgi:neural cell adhesion molecule